MTLTALKKNLMASVAATAFMAFVSGASAETLMLYTSQPDADAAATVSAFNQLHPNITVEVFRSGTSDVLSRLAAEFAGGSPQPDVLLIADAVSMELLKRDGRLMAYEGADVSGFDENAYDVDRTYFGTKLITTGIVHNNAASERPTSWADLTGEAYRNLTIMPSPLYSGAAAFLLAGFSARNDLGWKYFEQLQQNGLIAVRGNGAVLQSVASGERAYGILVDFMAMNAIADGSPIGFVFPEEGAPAVTEPVAILSTARNVDAARAFVDFVLSDAGQQLVLQQGYLPARLEIGRPHWLPEGVEVNVMSVDIDAVVATVEERKKQFATLFGG